MAEPSTVAAGKTLIVAPAWVGDMVMAHCLVRLVHQQDPAAEIHMLAPPATEPLARRMAEVSRTHEFSLAHGELGLGKRRRIGQSLIGERYARAIVLPNSFKSALTPWWANIPSRTGWHGESRFGLLNDRRRLDTRRYPLMIEQFMALGLPEGAPLEKPYLLPKLEVDEANASRVMEKLGLDRQKPVAVLCPGAEYGPAKRWPAEHYADLARHLGHDGYGVWLIGSPKDEPACREIVEAVPEAVSLAGRTTLLDALDLIAQAERVICNDSGLMHVAAALGRRVIAVFGSTSPDFTPPLGDLATVVRGNEPCSPCFERTCPLGHMNCLNNLAPECVIERL
jgi:heptosyltransferase-2